MRTEEELAILRRFEPVVRFTRGEPFFPMDVDRYVRQCSLWVKKPNEPAIQLLTEAECTLEALPNPRPIEFGSVQYLKFIVPLDIVELAKYSLSEAVNH